MEKGACFTHEPPLPLTMFFPENGKGGRGVKKGQDIYAVGKLFCKTFCEVRTECLMYFLEEEEGVFGGTDPRQRQQILRCVRVKTPAAIKGYVERNFS